jgi:23S rRNA (adenine2503-C2)-methyltransferase
MLKTVEKLQSSDDSIKYAFQDDNGRKFESIYFTLPTQNKPSHFICISSQAGCAMGCKFCATGYGGFFENLTPEKMMAEIEIINDEVIKNIAADSSTLFNIVLMGMGEPLMNYDNVVEFCYRAREKFTTLNKIFISTVGIPNRILQLADLDPKLNLKLYFSMHSPYNDERLKIMPITKKYSIESVLAACKLFSEKTSTRVKVTYLLLKNVNDTDQHARDFAKLLDPLYFEAQVLLYNTTPGLPYERVSEEVAYRFGDIIAESGIETNVKVSRGRDVNGGCGQFVKNVNEKTANRVLSGTFAEHPPTILS